MHMQGMHDCAVWVTEGVPCPNHSLGKDTAGHGLGRTLQAMGLGGCGLH